VAAPAVDVKTSRPGRNKVAPVPGPGNPRSGYERRSRRRERSL